MQKFIRYTKAICIAGALSFAATEASATILLSATNTTAQTGTAATTLNLNNTPTGTTLSFITPIAETVVITYNAECTLTGTDTQWAAVEILVDPAGATGPTLVAPTSTDRAFCAGTPSGGGWISAVAQAVIRVPAGVHRVSVSATPIGGGTFRIDDSSIVISDQ